MPSARPVTTALVAAVLPTGVPEEKSGLVPSKTSYLAGGDPPEAGAVHDRLTWASPAVAVSPVGAPGAPGVPAPAVAGAEVDAAADTGVADASPETFP